MSNSSTSCIFLAKKSANSHSEVRPDPLAMLVSAAGVIAMNDIFSVPLEASRLSSKMKDSNLMPVAKVFERSTKYEIF